MRSKAYMSQINDWNNAVAAATERQITAAEPQREAIWLASGRSTHDERLHRCCLLPNKVEKIARYFIHSQLPNCPSVGGSVPGLKHGSLGGHL